MAGSPRSRGAVRLLAPDLSMLEAAIEGPESLSRALGGYAISEGWEVFDGALPRTRDALAENPEGARWGTRLFVLDEPPTLVGWGGFKGPPAGGVVELGYAIAPARRGRGLAGDAVRELLLEAFSDGGVKAVIAHTLPEPGPSTRVLEKAGFAYEGEVTDEAGSRVWRWRHDRPAP